VALAGAADGGEESEWADAGGSPWAGSPWPTSAASSPVGAALLNRKVASQRLGRRSAYFDDVPAPFDTSTAADASIVLDASIVPDASPVCHCAMLSAPPSDLYAADSLDAPLVSNDDLELLTSSAELQAEAVPLGSTVAMRRSVSLTELSKMSISMRRIVSVDGLEAVNQSLLMNPFSFSEEESVAPLPSLALVRDRQPSRTMERDEEDSCECDSSFEARWEHGSTRSAARTCDGRDPHRNSGCRASVSHADDDLDAWSCSSQEVPPFSPELSPSVPRPLSRSHATFELKGQEAAGQRPGPATKRPTAKRGPRARGQGGPGFGQELGAGFGPEV